MKVPCFLMSSFNKETPKHKGKKCTTKVPRGFTVVQKLGLLQGVVSTGAPESLRLEKELLQPKETEVRMKLK